MSSTKTSHSLKKGLLTAGQKERLSSNTLIYEGKVPIFVEDSDDADMYAYRLEKVVADERTEFQDVLIADSINYGRMLVLDGAIQSAEDDEAMYHEMLVQPAMVSHSNPREVLIIGGGEGATLREVLRHSSVARATMVDLDRQVVDLCRKHLTGWHQGSFADPRARLVFDDGRKFVEENEDTYDVVIIDVVDMLNDGPAKKIYTREFYQHLSRRLNKGAIVAVQAMEFSFLDYHQHCLVRRTLQSVFKEVHSYKAQIPSFLSAWGFLIASDWFNPSQMDSKQFDAALSSRLGDKPLAHVDGEFLKSSFAMDKVTRRHLAMPGAIVEDDQPIPDEEDDD